MCGRYQLFDNKNKEIKKIIEEVRLRYSNPDFPVGEIFPSNLGVILTLKNGELYPELMIWGYPFKEKLIINARSENLHSYFYADDFQKRRCVVPVSGFYEWDSSRKKHYISSSENEALYLGAIYRNIDGTNHYCIITKDASERLKPIHSRMPVIMNKEQAIEFLSRNS